MTTYTTQLSYHSDSINGLSSHATYFDEALDGSTRIVKVIGEHEVEHLISFTTAATRIPPDAEASMKRLRQLHNASRLKITRCLLTFQASGYLREITVVDLTSKEEVERFNLSRIVDPVYRESNDTAESFNNILMFNINAATNSDDGPDRHEMHIFQCLSCPAHVIVNNILEQQNILVPSVGAVRYYNSASPKFTASATTLPYPTTTSQEQWPIPKTEKQLAHIDSPKSHRMLESRGSVITTSSHRNASSKSSKSESPVPVVVAMEHPQQFSETPLSPAIVVEHPSAQSHRSSAVSRPSEIRPRDRAFIDAEVELLNRCFEDIEEHAATFVKLHQAQSLANVSVASHADNLAISTKNDKKKGRFRLGLHKKKDNKKKVQPNKVNGVVGHREVVVPKDDMIDFLEKIKFAIILLSRLQGYVTEPNPPALAHKLFTIALQPIELSRDEVTQKPEIAREVIRPLFTRDALQLLRDSLIEPCIGLWKELGDGWNVASEDWQHEEPVYIPTFLHGSQLNPHDYHNTLFHLTDAHTESGTRYDGSISTRSTPTVLGTPDSPQMNSAFYGELSGRGARIVKVLNSRQGKNTKELTVSAGDILELLDNSRNWYKLRNENGEMGYCPYTILKVLSNEHYATTGTH